MTSMGRQHKDCNLRDGCTSNIPTQKPQTPSLGHEAHTLQPEVQKPLTTTKGKFTFCNCLKDMLHVATVVTSHTCCGCRMTAERIHTAQVMPDTRTPHRSTMTHKLSHAHTQRPTHLHGFLKNMIPFWQLGPLLVSTCHGSQWAPMWNKV